MNDKIIYVKRGTSVRYVEPRSNFTSSELDDFIKSADCNFVVINHMHGMAQENVDEAFKCKNIKSLRIVCSNISFGKLTKENCIKKIVYNDTLKEPFDFSEIKELKSLQLKWGKGLIDFEQLNNLEEFYLNNYKGDAAELKKLNHLKVFVICEANIQNLDFLESYNNIQRVEFYYLSKLTNIEGLKYTKKTLKELKLDHLSKLNNYSSVLSELRLLETLRLVKCKDLSDLEFINNLKKLNFFAFIDMKILNNDLTPCLGFNYVGFKERKSYNCTWDKNKKKLKLKSS